MKIDHQNAWDELLDATPAGCYVGRPRSRRASRVVMYAFDPSERAVAGVRNREWTAVAPTEVAVVLEMARCLREISEGRAPR